jgi:Sec-independent protein secretion pathway component TatC
MEIPMSVGPIELVLLVFVFILALGAHVIIAMPGWKKEHRRDHRGFLVYGFPICFAIALILTPPDPLSMLLIAIPCSLAYGFLVVMWILRRARACPPGPNG